MSSDAMIVIWHFVGPCMYVPLLYSLLHKRKTRCGWSEQAAWLFCCLCSGVPHMTRLGQQLLLYGTSPFTTVMLYVVSSTHPTYVYLWKLFTVGIHPLPQKPIIDCGFLPELSQLLVLQQYPEIQFHAAGTIRNLATEEFSQVHWQGIQKHGEIS